MFHHTKLDFKEELKPRSFTSHIILLHSMDSKPHTVEDVHRVHQNKEGLAGIAYHYFINKNGDVFEGRPHDTKGAFHKDYNRDSIGVCFQGDFNKEKMGERQMNGSIMLLSLLSLAYETDSLLPYWKCKEEWGSPSSNFPFNRICQQVEECKNQFRGMFGEQWGESEDDYFVPDYEWRHFHDHLGDEEEEWHRHNAPAYPIHMGNFNYFKIIGLLNDIEEDYYWEKEDF